MNKFEFILKRSLSLEFIFHDIDLFDDGIDGGLEDIFFAIFGDFI